MQIGNLTPTTERPLIIAEIGSNWRTKEDCVLSIKEAANCGADVVKFQCFNFESFYGPNIKKPSHYDSKAELPIEWISQLKNECDNSQVQLMVSCFGPDLVRPIDAHVSCHKVASGEITHIDLLEELAGLGKPVFLSVGGASEPDISRALGVLKGCDIVLNYCVGAYPSTDTDLFVMDRLKEYGHPLGFSDHSMDYTYLPRAAVKHHGAIAVEKHVSFVQNSGADSSHSLKPHEFRLMVKYLRDQIGSVIGPGQSEADMLNKWQRRLVALTDISQGDIFSYKENVGACRSLTGGTGDSPFNARSYRGMQAVRDIKAGDCIRRIDFK